VDKLSASDLSVLGRSKRESFDSFIWASQSITSGQARRNSIPGPGGGTRVLAKSMAGCVPTTKNSGRLVRAFAEAGGM
jgi:hypothetical protein